MPMKKMRRNIDSKFLKKKKNAKIIIILYIIIFKIIILLIIKVLKIIQPIFQVKKKKVK
jgi:hypothetical protein